ncbi:MAG TPA: DUF6542 domain-containing protein [Amycolatopsis sp.]|nr:DUF6542 domain-containing protein [Amycolatopsis sp.]
MAWDTRPIIGERRGLPWWGAVLVAFGLAVLGAVVDMKTAKSLSWGFNVLYFAGCVGAICAVQRRSLFGPMVQPPLILAVSVPAVVVLVVGMPTGSDTLSKALAVGTPLINGFPTMAVTTGFTIVIGIYRLYRERNPDAPEKGAKSARPTDSPRPPRPERPRDPGRPRAGQSGQSPQPGREGAGRGQRSPDGRGGGPRRPAREDSLPPGRRPPPGEGPRRGDPAVRGNRTPPPPGARRPRGGVPDDPDGRRAGGPPRADRPRRMPPRSGDPRGGPQGGDPRRAPGRGAPPPRRRPWNDDA